MLETSSSKLTCRRNSRGPGTRNGLEQPSAGRSQTQLGLKDTWGQALTLAGSFPARRPRSPSVQLASLAARKLLHVPAGAGPLLSPTAEGSRTPAPGQTTNCALSRSRTIPAEPRGWHWEWRGRGPMPPKEWQATLRHHHPLRGGGGWRSDTHHSPRPVTSQEAD